MRKLCAFAVSFSAAVFLANYLLPARLWLPAGLLCTCGALLSRLLHGDRRLLLALVALGLAAGFFRMDVQEKLVHGPIQAYDGTTEAVTATVLDFPQRTSIGGAALDVRLHLEDAPDCKAVVYAGADALSLRPGDAISAEDLRMSASDTLKGADTNYYRSKGVYLRCYANGALTVERPERVPVRFWPKLAARALKDSIAACFPADAAGFVTALITSDRAKLPDGVYAAFQRSGIAHVVAVSGLHISFFAGFLATLLGRRRKSTGVAVILAVFFFAALAGSSPSALRAAFMASFLLLASLFGREDDKPTTLAAVLMLLLLPNPYAACSVSLQLSFGAVAGIHLVTGALDRRWQKVLPKGDKLPARAVRGVGRFAFSTLATTCGALLFTTPLVAVYFRSVSLASPLTNLLTLWAVSDLFIGALLCALVGLALPAVGAAAGWALALLARWVTWVSTGISARPFAALSLNSPVLVVWLVAAYAILLLWLAGHLRKRVVRPLVPIAACLLPLCAALVAASLPSATGTLTVAALDVGQGASTVLYSHGVSAVVDCGGNGADDAGDTAADYLNALGLDHLDLLVLTHYHTDHANGVPELLARVDVDTVLLPDVEPEEPLRAEIVAAADKRVCKVVFITGDTELSLGAATLQVFAPLGGGGANEEGLSLLCSAGRVDALITGDMNSVVEKRLVKEKNLPDIELLVVGHHGSKYATSEVLLDAVAPEWAAISSGYNSYGHPAPETLGRLADAGCQVRRTDQLGTVTFTVK